MFLFALKTFAQMPSYNLTGLKSVKLQLMDPGKVMNVQTAQKLLSECKVKLAALGVEVKENDATAALQFKIDVGASGIFTNPDVLLRLELLEKVQTFSEKFPRTEAKTYTGIFWETIQKQKLNEDCYSLFMDKLFLQFIDQWVTDNKITK